MAGGVWLAPGVAVTQRSAIASSSRGWVQTKMRGALALVTKTFEPDNTTIERFSVAS